MNIEQHLLLGDSADRLKEKLLSNHIKTDNGCWEWIRGYSNDGYGMVYDPQKKGNRRVNRVSYEIFNGEITNNLFVCHSCNNKKCINPNHLYLGDNKKNQLDAVRDGIFEGLQNKRLETIMRLSDSDFNNWIIEKSKNKNGRQLANVNYYKKQRKIWKQNNI